MTAWQFVSDFMWSWMPFLFVVWFVLWLVARGGGVLRRYWRD